MKVKRESSRKKTGSRQKTWGQRHSKKLTIRIVFVEKRHRSMEKHRKRVRRKGKPLDIHLKKKRPSEYHKNTGVSCNGENGKMKVTLERSTGASSAQP